MKEVILTPEGYEKLKKEIELLQTERRREVAERIRVAREFGDIAENAEYDDAKNEQAMLEHKINQLEDRLLTARVITKREISKDSVSVGSKVRLRDVDAKVTVEYHIVGSAEANPAENKLSNESPVGKAIMGKKKGETVTVAAPRGALTLQLKDGEKNRSQTITIPADTPVVALAGAQAADVQRGARVVVFVHRDAGGTPIADRVIVGRNGIAPPL